MRWSLQRQLLMPMVAVLVLSIGLSSLASAYLGISSARQLQYDQLRRAASTLTESTFPLTQPVLESIRNLTGAEYIVLSSSGQVQSATLQPPAHVLNRLRTTQRVADLKDFSQQPVVRIGERDYFAARIPRTRSAAAGQESVLVLAPRNGGPACSACTASRCARSLTTWAWRAAPTERVVDASSRRVIVPTPSIFK